ncbi:MULTISPECIES: bifunctional tetrahydrofolate synthase/dihydrofolate synthase [Thiorhodovibrio]|uniref:bifunctional tetrahydrofolate synthase/dihydrofolate synthase n=1 Tax=Thiorhodovibrio TaxID=61593 RepID=UPI0019139311|nr:MULTISPECIES: bifunctional tetrahydrofolate synthase/dihydrofolate synthase [Thiorhodovibrio]MBK5970595.1 bifunctional tetrahydrofolate synthase/dihydrofolate synthase [Thiorhodovibrio winogradskyi]WPL12780.1 Bifunctional protein FolC [Thiorhodovibrio litoralis]
MRWNTLSEWLSWQEGLHPKRIDLRLERLAEVWQQLGPPPLPGPVITVGGTNGKGSTVTYLDACCRAAGLTTGVYTSPHLLRYNERVRVDGQEASDQALCEAFDRIDQARGDISLTYFEFGTLAALELFSRARVDIVLLEVGLGGRLDAVNLLDADIAIVTSIGRDHMAWLGDDPDQIAFEKAGIFRPERPAIIASREPPPRLREQAEAIGARVHQLGREFDWELSDAAAGQGGWHWRHRDGTELSNLPLPALSGRVQLDNAAAALCALHLLGREQHGARSPREQHLRAGLAAARLPGRFQLIPGAPQWILDVAHNQDAARVLAENLRGLEVPGYVHLVFAVFADKEAAAIAEILSPVADFWYLAEPPGARAMPVRQLAAQVRPFTNAEPLVCESLHEALDQALICASGQDLIVVTGSFMTVEAGLRYRLPTAASDAIGAPAAV